MEKQTLSFKEFGFNPSILKSLKKMGFNHPTPIQQKVIPSLLEGKDVIGQAQTGTGKTAAFALPVLELMNGDKKTFALVLTPTRELARQVSEQLNRFGEFVGIKSTTVCGGEAFNRQIEKIKQSRVLVATPGRLLDLYRTKRLKHFNPSFIIFDEADEMLDMGFLEDIEKIISYLPAERQTILFSATMSKPIKKLAKKLLQDPLSVNLSAEHLSNQQIEQKFYLMHQRERYDALIRLIDSDTSQKALIFCSTKKDVDHLSELLSKKGYVASALHGDMAQAQRKRAIDSFRFGRCPFLIATDVAARGLDVSDITHVYNLEIPFSDESYVHRIGRTGRAGKKGIAVTFLTPKDKWWLNKKKDAKVESIPTFEEVRKSKMEKIISEIRTHPVEAQAFVYLDELKNHMDINEINASLLSLLLKNEDIAGPNRIGLTLDEFKAQTKSTFRKQKFKKRKPFFKKHRKALK